MKTVLLCTAVLLLSICMCCATTPTGPAASPSPQLTAPPFTEVRRQHATMTTAEWDVFRDTLIGARVDWEGWVSDVQALSDGYMVFVDLDPPHAATPLGNDVNLTVTDRRAAALQKGDRICFSGTVVDVWVPLTTLTVKLADATFQPTP